ncbi:uncharacterized protein B0P05DRAFT_573226 [Gilbertella persicaria]|uniref:uncharacterized protein n=1 Tax=Gilbertella persicaria TaxID=101096 RepID=UPI00222084C6|nr:uncharacterized protein B0P05DRAFT_573226 [Gilbertella persicaria]KAI8071157.1 hypothetical protein B0P05DRAFT_573226 [Gilbertella persicaria]
MYAFRETNLSLPDFKNSTVPLSYKLQAYQSIWTTKCDLVNNNRHLQMDHVKTSDDNRIIVPKFSVTGEAGIHPFYIFNIYAPASNVDNARIRFFQLLMDFIDSLDSSLDIMSSMIVVGDFNFSFEPIHISGSHSSRPKKFMSLIAANFSDCLNSKDDDDFYNYFPTFRRGKSMSCIDYIFAGGNIRRYVTGSELEFLSPKLTDHALLTTSLRFGYANTGKGLWRADPYLATKNSYCHKIQTSISHFMTKVLANTTYSPQLQWDRFKGYVRKITQNYYSNRASWRKKRLKELQSKRNFLCRLYKQQKSFINTVLPEVENEIAVLQNEMFVTATLRAGKVWMEKSERNLLMWNVLLPKTNWKQFKSFTRIFIRPKQYNVDF